MNKIYVILFYLLLLLASCKSKSSSDTITEPDEMADKSENSYDSDEGGVYEDGSYCATIEYYNPNTGTSSTYTLTVEVESGELAQINWPNGGWLDDTHFSRPTIDNDGSCSFTTYEGQDYSIQIDEEGSCVGSVDSPDEDDENYYEDQRLEREQEKEDIRRKEKEQEEEEQNSEEESENTSLYKSLKNSQPGAQLSSNKVDTNYPSILCFQDIL